MRRVLNERVLLVGNGPSALSLEKGEEIDRFPFVCRFNDFKVRGFERWVGSKCTHLFVNKRCVPVAGEREDLGRVVHAYLAVKGKYERVPVDRILLEKFSRVDRVPKWVWDETCMAMGCEKPSCGALAAMMFTSMRWEVWLYGFDFFRTEVNHYGDSVKKSECHKAEKEVPYFREMVGKEKISLFGRYTVL